MVEEARNNKSTKSNKILNQAQEAYNTVSSKLNAIESAVSFVQFTGFESAIGYSFWYTYRYSGCCM